MTTEKTSGAPLPAFHNHPRHWRDNLYVYPVVSRRGRGLSIGINLNPDSACNFDCVYCQVDRSVAPRVREVDVDRLRAELERMLEDAKAGSLFDDPSFADVPADLRILKDLAFSGDGEPTTCKHFLECVRVAASLKRRASLDGVKIVLITDACYLTKPDVVEALSVLDDNDGEVWAKLDAGTEDYYARVNRPNFPLDHVVENIISVAKVRPVVIQSLFMRLHGEGPGETELQAYAARLRDVMRSGGSIGCVQVYTVARRPAEDYVTALSDDEVDAIAGFVRRETGLQTEAFHADG